MTEPYRSSVPGRDGFAGLLRAEWTKLRSVRRWLLTLVAAAALTLLVGLLAAAGSGSEVAGDGPAGGGDLSQVRDEGHFVYRRLEGDGELVARVASQDASHEWAKAGLMLRAGDRTGSRYAAVVVTPEHGVRLQSDFTHDEAGSDATAPRWLRLTRDGDAVSADESADGTTWTPVGTVRLEGLPATVDVGLVVASPNAVNIERQFGGETVDEEPTNGRATFDGVRLVAAGAEPGAWHERDRSIMPGSISEAGGTFTVVGSGDIGPDEFRDDVTRTTLSGVAVGIMAIVALAVLFVTAEFRRGMIRTTFAAAPGRVGVLAAKAAVMAVAAFVAGLAGAVAAFLLAGPLVGTGSAAPSLADGPVLRAVVGTGLLVAAVAAFSVGVASLTRRSATAICAVVLLLLVPEIVSTGLPLSVAMWVERLTPAAGFAVQETVRRYDTAIGPWAGLGVITAYAALALALAAWRLQRRDA